MALKEWETIIQRIVDETNRESKEAGKYRLLVEWRAKLEAHDLARKKAEAARKSP